MRGKVKRLDTYLTILGSFIVVALSFKEVKMHNVETFAVDER